jgi:hypothetical protein
MIPLVIGLHFYEKWGSAFEQETIDRRIFNPWSQGKPTASSEQTLAPSSGQTASKPQDDFSASHQNKAS